MAQQVLKNTVATLDVVFLAGAADASVTVTSTRADGTAGPSGTATHVSGGEYTFALAPQAELDLLTFTWSGNWSGVANSIQTQVEIVGGYLFALADLRQFGDQVLANSTAYPDAALREARERVSDLFRDACQTAFFPRFWRETLDGNNSRDVFTYYKRPRRIIAATVGGTAATDTATMVLYQTGRVHRVNALWPFDYGNVTLSYEYGWPYTPSDVKRAGLMLARYELVSSDISDRMISFQNDLGSVRLSVPGRNYPTGIPYVDATLSRYDETDAIGP